MGPDQRTGLFSSSLVTQELNGDSEQASGPRPRPLSPSDIDFEKRAAAQAYRIQPASEIEASFRHGLWSDEREKVRAALVAANVPVARIERFNACGANCIIEYAPSIGKHRVRASYCHDRFCKPCMVARAKQVRKQIEEWCQGATVRFMTFTLKPDGRSLKAALDHLLTSFRRLRQQKLWGSHVDGGVGVVEITRGSRGDSWHVHLHVLALGTFIDQKELSAGWKKASRGSFIVDVRALRDPEVAVAYVAKYATKGWTDAVVDDPDSLLECVLSLRGRRLLCTFGEWHGRDDQLCKAEQIEYKRVGRLDVIYRDAIDGKPYALGVFRSLGIAVGRANERPIFFGCDPPSSDLQTPVSTGAGAAFRESTHQGPD